MNSRYAGRGGFGVIKEVRLKLLGRVEVLRFVVRAVVTSASSKEGCSSQGEREIAAMGKRMEVPMPVSIGICIRTMGIRVPNRRYM